MSGLQTHPPTYEEIKGFLWSLLMVQARLAPLFVLLPFMNRNFVPRVVALAIITGLGLLVAPTLPASPSAWPEGMGLIGLVLKEAFIGFALGFLCSIPFWVLEAVGFIIDNHRGASIASTINPFTGDDSSPLGLLFSITFITFFLVSGGTQLLFGLVYDSYRLWPILTFWPELSEDAASLLLVQLNRLIFLALMLAAPAMVAMFLSEIGLALVNRFAPQLQVFFLAMPIKSGLALLVLVVYASTLFDYAGDPMREVASWIDRLDPYWRKAR